VEFLTVLSYVVLNWILL